MPFDSIISRSDADALIPEQYIGQIITATTRASAAATLFRSARMSRKLARQPVLSVLPSAHWVSGDTGLKMTTKAAWEDAELVAEELAAVIPVPEAVLLDAQFAIFDELRDAIGEALAEKIDQATLAGIDKPASWTQALVPAARAAGNVVEIASTPAMGGIGNDLDLLLGVVEDAGFDVTGIAAKRALRGMMRRARNAQGDRSIDVAAGDSYLNVPIAYGPGGTLDDDTVAVAGAFDLAVLGVRQDMTFKVLDQAVITNEQNEIIYNLPQQDMLALRVVARYGFATAIPATRDAPDGDGFPFAVLEAAEATGRRTREPAAERKAPAAKK